MWSKRVYVCLSVPGSSIGRNVCLYPGGGDPMMTEPGDDFYDHTSYTPHLHLIYTYIHL